MAEVILKGRGAVSGVVEGYALVCPQGISAFGGIDLSNGQITEYDNVNKGQSIKDSILLMPSSKGSNGWSCYFTACFVAGLAPKGWAFTKVDSSAGVASSTMNIPTVVDFKEDICQIIQNGDYLRLDGDAGTIEVLKSAK